MNVSKKPEDWIEELRPNWESVFEACSTCPAVGSARGYRLPGQGVIVEALNGLVAMLFPGCLSHDASPAFVGDANGTVDAAKLARSLYDCVLPVAKYYCDRQECVFCGDCEKFARESVQSLFKSAAEIRETLQQDVQSAYEGDPAATSQLEVVMSYPGLYAITVHRIAHQLVKAGVPLIPRVMSE